MSNYWIIFNSEFKKKAVEPNSPGLILRYYSGISVEVQRNTKNLGKVDNPGEFRMGTSRIQVALLSWDNFLGNRVIVNISRLFQECS